MRNPAILSCTDINIQKQAVLFQAPLKLETALFFKIKFSRAA